MALLIDIFTMRPCIWHSVHIFPCAVVYTYKLQITILIFGGERSFKIDITIETFNIIVYAKKLHYYKYKTQQTRHVI